MKTLLIVLSLSVPFVAFGVCSGEERVFQAVDPVDASPWAMTSKQYAPARPGAPVVFIIPPIVGETILDRRLASKLCRKGVAAFILHVSKAVPSEREATDLAIHDESYVRALGGVRAATEALEAQGTFSARYGVLGMSLGGMLSAYVAGAEPKIAASVIVAGAGNAAGVLATSDQELVVRQRTTRLASLGFVDPSNYEATLRQAITCDPLSVAGNIKPDSMYIFIARKDTTVPTRYQRELRAAVRSPLVFEMNAAHTMGLIKAGTIHAGKITRFLVKRLKD
jgi:dienelactone hydrolase